MTQRWTFRLLIAVAVAVGGIAAALWMGAPVLPVLISLLAGGVAAVLVEGSAGEAVSNIDDGNGTEELALPDTAEILNAMDEPRLIVRDRRVVLANPAARALLGQHVEGVDVRLAIRHPAAAERLTDRAGAEEARTTKTELIGLGEPGRRWEMITSSLPDGSLLVRLNDRSEAYAIEQMRADFVANASHELRTPLATVLGFLETLQDETAANDPKTRSRFLKVMFDEAIRMRNLVEDLMSLSRIEAGRFSVPRDPVALVPLIEEAISTLASLAEERESEILVVRESEDAVVAGDRPQLAQLLNNLLANALKYGRPGTPVRVRLNDAGPEMIRISIIDQGEGIEAEHLPRLTERFYRVDPGRSRSVGGTGLGLAIVKHIVGRHRGRLDIRSTVGEGTAVQVYLPRVQDPVS